MLGRVALVRAVTGELLHPELEVMPGDDTRKLSQPGDITFAVAPEWHKAVAPDGSYYLDEQKTLVVVEAPNRQIRQVGLVQKLTPRNKQLDITCGGFSMSIAQSGPWEGHQGYYVTMDPLTLFRQVVQQATSYSNSVAGIRVTGDTRTGSTVGYPGSARWQAAYREYSRHKPQLDLWEGRRLTRERILGQRKEAMFKAAGLRRVGDVTETDDGERPPDDPGWAADSTLWIRKDQGELGRWGRAYRWRNGRWVSQSQADNAVRRYRGYVSTVEAAKDEVDRLRYLMEPAQELLDEYENEAREEYSLYFWQNHDLNEVMEQLMQLGPFEFRERASWLPGDKLDLQLEVGAPRVGVRRPELHLELGHNVHGEPVREYGTTFTGLTLFGAGSGSAVLSEQRNWNPQHAVRNIAVETDKDAHTRALTRAAANKLRDKLREQAGLRFTQLTVHHDEACAAGSFDVGDMLFITGYTTDGIEVRQWVRVLELQTPWGSNKSVIEVENA